MQLAGEALVLRLGPEAGDAAALVVGVESQMEADGILDAADETHAGIGLFFHDAASLCRLHYSIDAGFEQTSLIPNSGHKVSWGGALSWADFSVDRAGFRVYDITIVRPASQPDCAH